jgi:ABC-type polysaccharide/polyol phosphate export permease
MPSPEYRRAYRMPAEDDTKRFRRREGQSDLERKKQGRTRDKMNPAQYVASFIRGVFLRRQLIIDLTRSELKSRFVGSYLGILWAFIQPIIVIIIFWFVFQQGFKTPPAQGFPFILYLGTGIIPYFFFSDGITTASSSIIEKSFLVKKVVFQISILPVVKLISALVIHVILVLFLFFLFLCYGYYPDLYWLQVPYYIFVLFLLMIGISWITSASIVFFRDINQVVAVLLQILFWTTPIFWSLDIVPSRYRFLLKLNPLYYIVEGFRDCLMRKVWFWSHPALTLYFIVLTTAVTVLGGIFFKKLKPHFADVI